WQQCQSPPTRGRTTPRSAKGRTVVAPGHLPATCFSALLLARRRVPGEGQDISPEVAAEQTPLPECSSPPRTEDEDRYPPSTKPQQRLRASRSSPDKSRHWPEIQCTRRRLSRRRGSLAGPAP